MAYKNPEDRRTYQREYMRERRAMFKRFALCKECGRQDTRTMSPSHAYCEACAAKRRAYPHSVEDRRLLELCTQCGAPALVGRQVCEKHLEHMREMTRKKCEGKTPRKTDGRPNPDAPKSQWPELGFCRVCGDPKLPTYKVCQRCYDRLAEMRQKQKAEGSDALLRQAIDTRWRDIQTRHARQEAERRTAREGFKRWVNG